jgi:hypothetical protein
MAGYVTLAPASGVSLRVQDDVVHVGADHADGQPTAAEQAPPPHSGHHAAPVSPPPPKGQGQASGGIRIGGPRRPLDVWTTFVAPDLPSHERHMLSTAPQFDSLAELAESRGRGLPRSEDGHTLFARVRASGAIPMSHIEPILRELPDRMHLVVAVERKHGR